ncbi:MarR family transcriptional regulator [bacterium]|nr:MarR family transcriptional regulator [bacterium]HPF34186.1 MarR family transcriptional regulator [Candidatus Krumholzibacteria bacterium]HRX50171.1 MarR family transcriptional regulator [Candidatus Krumholzibacteria bacterium]
MSGRPTLRGRRQEAFLALMVAHDALQRRTQEFMKGFGLTVHQYNVLRILRGAGPAGKPSQSIAADMISKVPDVTRLVDRLSAAGYVTRGPDPDDRRVVRVRILPKGLELLAAMDEPIHDLHALALGDLTASELDTLLALLRRL